MILGKHWKIRLVQTLALLMLLAVCILPLLKSDDGQTALFSQGWTWNGQPIDDLLSATKVDNPDNASVVIENTIPKSVAEAGFLLIRTSQQTLYVSVGGETIYAYDPIDTQPYGDAAPSQWNMVALPDNSQGQSIAVTFYSPVSHYASVAQCVRYGTEYELAQWIFTQHFAKFLIGFAVAVIGFLTYIIYFFLEHKRGFGYSGLFIFTLGLWCVCESGFLIFLPGSSYFWGVLTFQTLWLASLFFCLIMDEVLEGNHSTVKYVAVLCSVLQWTLYVLGVADFIEMLPMTYILLVLTFIENIYVLVKAWKRAGEQCIYIQGFLQLLLLLLLSFVLEYVYFMCNTVGNQGVFISVGIVLCLFGTGVQSINVLSKESAHTAAINRDLLQQRVAMVRSQIQPHFLFNTLTSIRALIRIDADKAYELVGTFSQYLRANINAFDEEGLVSFDEEITHIRTYMDIELVRFGARVAMMYDIRSTDFFVPPLSIQPLVENAVKHGVCKRERGGTVTLRSFEDKKSYVIELIDNGVGFVPEKVRDNGVGLSNGIFRLQTLANAKVDVKSTVGKGTTIRILIPKTTTPKEGTHGSITH